MRPRETQNYPLDTPDRALRRYRAMTGLKFLAQEWPAIDKRLDEALSLAPGQRDIWLVRLVETDCPLVFAPKPTTFGQRLVEVCPKSFVPQQI